MSNLMHNTTQTSTGSSMLEAKSQLRPEHATGLSGRDDVGDVRLADQQWSIGQQQIANNKDWSGAAQHADVPVITTTQTVTEIRETNVPLQTVPLPTEQHILVTDKQLPTLTEQQVPTAVPVGHPNLDVFQDAASKAKDFHARIESRERDKMLLHEAKELEHKKLENQHKKDEWKHEKSHKKHLAEQELHASLTQHHAEEMERQHQKHIKEQEKLYKLLGQHTEEMKEAHEAHLKKLEALKSLVVQHTHDMKMEQQQHLAEQQRHHDLIKSHSEEVEKHKLEAERQLMEAELARSKKEREERMKISEKERKEAHEEVKEEARVMPGGSGVLGGIKDTAHKAKVVIGL